MSRTRSAWVWPSEWTANVVTPVAQRSEAGLRKGCSPAGHEWAKRQAGHAGVGFTELSNGFAATDDPARSARRLIIGLAVLEPSDGVDEDEHLWRLVAREPRG
jgi:hypothetical protein